MFCIGIFIESVTAMECGFLATHVSSFETVCLFVCVCCLHTCSLICTAVVASSGWKYKL